MDWTQTTSGNRFSSVGTVTGTSAGTVITAGAANVKGSWVALSAATPVGASGVTLIMNNASATLVASRLIDIGFGAAGAEMIVIPNILYCSGIVDVPAVVHFSIRVPNGVRLAARMAASTASTTITMSAILHTPVWSSLVPNQRVVAYGAGVASASRGTSITPGGTANTKPTTWTTISASTTEAMRGIIIGLGNQVNATRSVCSWLIDVGVGPASSEQILIPDYAARGSTNETVEPMLSPMFPVSVPAGSRLSVRAACNVTTANLFDIVLYSVV